MKKIIILLIAILCLNGCWKEEIITKGYFTLGDMPNNQKEEISLEVAEEIYEVFKKIDLDNLEKIDNSHDGSFGSVDIIFEDDELTFTLIDKDLLVYQGTLYKLEDTELYDVIFKHCIDMYYTMSDITSNDGFPFLNFGPTTMIYDTQLNDKAKYVTIDIHYFNGDEQTHRMLMADEAESVRDSSYYFELIDNTLIVAVLNKDTKSFSVGKYELDELGIVNAGTVDTVTYTYDNKVLPLNSYIEVFAKHDQEKGFRVTLLVTDNK